MPCAPTACPDEILTDNGKVLDLRGAAEIDREWDADRRLIKVRDRPP